MCCNIGIYYASSGGRTKRVTRILSGALNATATVEVFDLRSARISDFEVADLLIFGSPTYGRGELHPRWIEWKDTLAASTPELQGVEVAVFALGDFRHHRKTYGDAIWKLDSIRSAIGATAIGKTHSHVDASQRLPGLVVDAISRRNTLATEIESWASQLVVESDFIS